MMSREIISYLKLRADTTVKNKDNSDNNHNHDTTNNNSDKIRTVMILII